MTVFYKGRSLCGTAFFVAAELPRVRAVFPDVSTFHILLKAGM